MPLITPSDVAIPRWATAPVNVGPSSVAETTLVSQQIPAGLLGANGMLRCDIGGDCIFNADSAGTMQLRVYAGPHGGGLTTIFDGTTAAIAQSANRRALVFAFKFKNMAAQNANQLYALAEIGGVIAPATGTSGWGTSDGGQFGRAHGIASRHVTIDTSVAWDFKVTLTLSESQATVDARTTGAVLEVVTATLT